MSSQPTTALIILGNALFLQPSDDVLSLTLFSRDDFSKCFSGDGNKATIEESSIETLHIIVKSTDFSNMYDPDALISLSKFVKSGCGTVSVHLLAGEWGQPGMEDVDVVKTSLIMAGLRLDSLEERDDGSKILTGEKTSDENKES
uniref:Uncharacterized protein n=1 Tax=Corethron hystrix TaxID=216773 RepID=A0A7S1BZ52_9STRA|eukprot:CAMPEP_0113297054 /NCGR_PEP_ID=MMETSP0010_2-20120614/77_1 /TAXON_ID=216773 ORGANISM="Corethron hystrix, Strain 308" /NCGR_SAMPLE_ID=MMETSP0010_2 /ASSEMBLY_ACC=CAM_ASM_000155 /LENGTH=144 /DNA_ID=CAMNT_0000149881 /DNA_START=31 /DNA_END=465 /DNA_ORIENTATION=- /assembly_acc=CAM_ASM_000155